MDWYWWAALFAFTFKAYWWFKSKNYGWADWKWYWLLGAFSLLNLVEFFAHDLSGSILYSRYFL
jgi:hypothetical protein